MCENFTMSFINSTRVILRDGVSFSDWRADLQAELSRSDVLGHVFHNVRGIDPETEPEEPTYSKGDNLESYDQKMVEYKSKLRAWIKGEFEAQNIIIQRLDSSKKPQDYQRYTSKDLYEMVARANEVTSLLPHSEAFDVFVSTKFTTTADEYCTRFIRNLTNVNNAADSLSSSRTTATRYKITDELAAVFFVKGTENIKWLDIWRETKAVNISQYASLNHMITTLRASAGKRNLAARNNHEFIDEPSISTPVAAAARNNGRSRCKRCRKFHASKNCSENTEDDTDQASNDPCKLCKHDHANKDCYKQHPERAPQRWLKREESKGRNYGKAAISISRNFDTSDESEEDLFYLKAKKR